MKKNIQKIAAVSLAAVVAFTSIGYAAFTNSETEVKADDPSAEEAEDTIKKTIEDSVSFSTEGVDKEETVYVIADANGTVTKTIVSDWLKNKEGSDTIRDKTDLRDIENVKSDAGYTEGTNNEITWEANGSDIYYQGISDKPLPVDVKITYYLDGTEIKPNDLAGRSGKVKIRFDYVATEKQEVQINGKNVELYVPFIMVSGILLSNDNFTNIEVTNGKVINDGDRSIVVGVGFAGLCEDLDLSAVMEDSNLELPNYVEITADVKDFSLLMTLTFGTADLLNAVKVDDTNTMEELEKKIDELISGTNQLKDGADQLESGAATLKTSFVTYAAGIHQLSDGIYALDSGAKQLAEKSKEFVTGLNTALDGTNQILAGLSGENGAVSGAKQLADGAAQINSGMTDLQNSIGNKDNQESVIGGISSLTDGANSLAAGIGTIEDAKNQNTDTVSGAISSIDSAAAQLSKGAETLVKSIGSSDYEQVVKDASKKVPETIAGAVLAIAEGALDLDEGLSQILAAFDDVKDKNGNVIQTGIVNGLQAVAQAVGGTDKNAILQDAAGGNPKTLQGGAVAVDNGMGQLQDGVTDMVKNIEAGIADNTAKMEQIESALAVIKQTGIDPATGVAATAEAVDTYKTNYAALSGANTALQSVIDQMNDANLDESIQALKSGTESLKEGTAELAGAISKLSDGVSELQGGVQSAKNGSAALAAGSGTLNTNMSKATAGAETLNESLRLLASGTEQLNTKTETLISGASALASGANKLNVNMPALQSGISDLKNGTEALQTGAVALSNGVQTLFTAVSAQLQPGLQQLYEGGILLSSSLDTLYSGTQAAVSGSSQIAGGTSQVSEGINKLAEGSKTLSDGMDEFKAEGIDKITDALNGDIKTVADRIKATIDVAKDYEVYSMTADDKTASVKFIYRTDKISK